MLVHLVFLECKVLKMRSVVDQTFPENFPAFPRNFISLFPRAKSICWKALNFFLCALNILFGFTLSNSISVIFLGIFGSMWIFSVVKKVYLEFLDLFLTWKIKL